MQELVVAFILISIISMVTFGYIRPSSIYKKYKIIDFTEKIYTEILYLRLFSINSTRPSKIIIQSDGTSFSKTENTEIITEDSFKLSVKEGVYTEILFSPDGKSYLPATGANGFTLRIKYSGVIVSEIVFSVGVSIPTIRYVSYL